MKFKLIDLLLYILLFVFVAAFPVDLFDVSEISKIGIQITLRFLLIAFYIVIIIINKIKIFKLLNWRNLLISSPLLIVCFSNMIASGISGNIVGSQITQDVFIANIFLTILVAISEEILFRLFIHNSLTKVGSFGRILGSAGIFALMHLLNLVSVRDVGALVTVLVQVVYNFGLGFILGFIIEFSHSLIACVVFHFAFNFFNDNLIKFYGFQSSEISFYLTAVIIAIVAFVYMFIVWKFYLNKTEKYYRS